jgi:Sulfotransferase domain
MDRLRERSDFGPGETAIRSPKVFPETAAALPERSAADRHRSLPTFFIVGPPRTGTSWLHDVLSGYALLPEPTKETRFFDVHFHRGLNWYLSHFPACMNDKRIGEVAPTYFASVVARERIRRMIPEARVVCVFRNPLQRVLSLYRVKRAYGMIPWTFEQAIVRDPELKASGMYATNLKAWRSAFGADRVLATVYDDLRDHPQRYLDTMLEFIGAPQIRLTQSQIKRVHGSDSMTHPRNYYWTRSATVMAEWFKARRFDALVASIRKSPLRRLFLGGGAAFNELSIEGASAVCDLFRPEIEELESILNRDFSSWKSIKG